MLVGFGVWLGTEGSFFGKFRHSEVASLALQLCKLRAKLGLCTIAMRKIDHVCFPLPISSLFTPVPHSCPPTQLVTATRWARLARHATRLQDSVPARTASPASPATAAPKATSRAARRWLHASVSSSHELSVEPVPPVAWYHFRKHIKARELYHICYF